MTLPPRIVATINTRTGQDIDNPEARARATTSRCPRCRAPILTGLDDEVAGLAAAADPTPLDRAGEARALIAGRATYTLTQSGRVTVLRYRDHWTITGRPADPAGPPVLPAHACGQPLGAARPDTRRVREAAHDQPPAF